MIGPKNLAQSKWDSLRWFRFVFALLSLPKVLPEEGRSLTAG